MFLNFLSISAPGNILILLSLIIQYVPVILAPSKSTKMTVAYKENCVAHSEYGVQGLGQGQAYSAESHNDEICIFAS